MNAEQLLLLGMVAATSCLATRRFWPAVQTERETRYIHPTPLNLDSVQYFSLDPQNGQLVYGVNGTDLQGHYLVRLDVKDENSEYWRPIQTIGAFGRYRFMIAKPDPFGRGP